MLVRELVRAGARYYSDEFAVLDHLGRVHPFLKPLAVRENGNGQQVKQEIESVGGHSGSKPMPVGLVVATSYRPGARWRPRRLSRGQGGLELLANAVAARSQTEAVLATLQQAVSNAEILKGDRGEAADTAAALLGCLGG